MFFANRFVNGKESKGTYIVRHLALVLLSAWAVGIGAQQPPHAEFPEGTLLALEGQDVISKKECLLFILEVPGEGQDFPARVSTSYGHGTDGPGEFILQRDPQNPRLAIGSKDDGKNRIAVMLDQEGSLLGARGFNLRWWHINHPHNYNCQGLKPHQEH
jgi:hypothetical protein